MDKRIADRFWSNVDTNGDCWAWLKSKQSSGYGQFYPRKGPPELAHRIAWELTNGPIHGRLCILHHCDNRVCVNPKHLFIGTHKDNCADMWRKGRGARNRTFNPWNKKLSKENIEEIKETNVKGECLARPGNTAMLARKFGVTSQLIRKVARRYGV